MKRKPLILTVQVIVLAILGCSSIPFLAPPTETPTPTATATATLTPTITPTSTPTLTPTPLPLVVIEELSSGGFLYRNRRIGLELTFPDNWIILDLVEGEADGSIEETLEEYPDLEESIQSAIEQMGARDAELIAFPTFDQEKGSRLSSFFTMMPQDIPGGNNETPMEEVVEFFGGFITELLNGIEVQKQEVIVSNSGRDIGKILFAWDLSAMFDSDAFGELFAPQDSNGEELDLSGEALLLQYNFVEIDDYLLLFVSTAPSSNLESFEDVDDIIRTIETIEVDIQSQ